MDASKNEEVFNDNNTTETYITNQNIITDASGLTESQKFDLIKKQLDRAMDLPPEVPGPDHRSDPGDFNPPPNGHNYVQPIEDPYSRAVKYLEKHNILPLFQSLTAGIVEHSPVDPLEFIANEVERLHNEELVIKQKAEQEHQAKLEKRRIEKDKKKKEKEEREKEERENKQQELEEQILKQKEALLQEQQDDNSSSVSQKNDNDETNDATDTENIEEKDTGDNDNINSDVADTGNIEDEDGKINSVDNNDKQSESEVKDSDTGDNHTKNVDTVEKTVEEIDFNKTES
ncbi:unnamed protein product [Owenia fusiformis]|uniref:Uncharacterized protein n=1 Tax=Owenia fusiformis TaxID=6347 RepID=A0A8J1XXU1_OWEFU|nr:unnamed protein product [Owenia fusiformis]